MLISHRHEFIYTKTIKTAGTSVESYFENCCMPEGQWTFSHEREEYVGESGIIGYRGSGAKNANAKWYNHMPAEEIKALIGDQGWDSYFKFCVVRNPFDKLISGFRMFEGRKPRYTFSRKLKAATKRLLGRGDPIDLVRGQSNVERFRSWIQNGGWIDDRNKYLIDGDVCVDFFIRYEHLQSDIESVCKRLEIPFEPDRIPKLKMGNRADDQPISEYYDAKTIEIVSDLYDLELEKFGYRLPQS